MYPSNDFDLLRGEGASEEAVNRRSRVDARVIGEPLKKKRTAITLCPELLAERAKLEDRIEAQRRMQRLKELAALRERAKLD